MSDIPDKLLELLVRTALIELAELILRGDQGNQCTQELLKSIPQLKPLYILQLAELISNGVLHLAPAEEPGFDVYYPDHIAEGVHMVSRVLEGKDQSNDETVYLLRMEVHPLPIAATDILQQLSEVMGRAALALLREHKIVSEEAPIALSGPNLDEPPDRGNMH